MWDGQKTEEADECKCCYTHPPLDGTNMSPYAYHHFIVAPTVILASETYGRYLVG